MNRKEYERLRPFINTGDIFGTAEDAFFSKAIRFFTRSEISHVGIFYWEGDHLYIAEAMEGVGVQILPASHQIQRFKFVGRIDTDRIPKEIVDNIITDSGLKYDTLGALLAPFKNLKNKKVFCSEWVAKILGIEFKRMKRGILPIDIVNKCDTILFPES